MKTFYSILYINLNAILNEKIAIGLFMSNGKSYSFKYSLEKLNAIKGMMDKEAYSFAKKYFHSLENEISNIDTNLEINFTYSLEKFSERYMSYLSRYANNLIQFSEPKKIDIEPNELNFNKLFEKFIFKSSVVEKVDNRTYLLNIVNKKLYTQIENHVNIDQEITNQEIENIIVPITLNFIGINGLPVTGQSINFEKQHHYLENDISRYISLTKAIEMDGKKGKYFVLGQEPSVSNINNHHLWKDLRNAKIFDYVDVSETERITDYIIKNEVKPYFEK